MLGQLLGGTLFGGALFCRPDRCPVAFLEAAAAVHEPPVLGTVPAVGQRLSVIAFRIRFAFDDPGGVLADGRSIYVFAAQTLSKIDVATNVVTALGTPDHVPAAFADDSAWAVDGTQLWRLDAHSFEPMTSWRISETEMQFARLAFAGGAVWVADEGGRVVRVNLDT
jgi:hypothetical protein